MRADPLTRRRFLAAAGSAAVGLSIAACGEDASRTSTAAAVRTPGRFPARVAHKFGTTVVDHAPRRVATHGGGDVDTLLALGVVPVLVPDLKRADYDKLSALAPTVPPPKGFAPYTVPWDTMAVQVGTGPGRRQEAERLVAQARDRISAASHANPAFAKSTAVLVATRKPQLGRTTDARSYQRLRAVREGPVVRIDDPDLAIAMSYTSLLSIPYQLREIVPRLRDALAA